MLDYLQTLVEPTLVFLLGFSWLILASGVLQNLSYIVLLILAQFSLTTRKSAAEEQSVWWRLADKTSPISILVPAYNESSNIIESVRSLLSLHYPQFEVIVINDGSKDNTLQCLTDGFGLKKSKRSFQQILSHKPIQNIYSSDEFPRLTVIDKVNGGKADALNAGINVSRYPLFCTIDADSILDADSLIRAVEPFAEKPDEVVAVGGTVRIANGCKIVNGRVTEFHLPRNFIALLQVVEYLRAFLMARVGWSRMKSMLMISGAFGIFSRSAALEIGGYNSKTVGEDMEIIVQMHRQLSDKGRKYEIRFLAEPVCWTEAPSSLGILSRQRRRWQRGSIEVFFANWRMLFNPKYGAIGMIGFPNLLISEIMGPILEFIGYLLIPLLYFYGYLSFDFFLAYLALTFSLGIFLSVGSLVLAEIKLSRYPKPIHLAALMIVAILENFGYRQLNNIWRFVGWYEFLRGKKEWGAMTRVGFNK